MGEPVLSVREALEKIIRLTDASWGGVADWHPVFDEAREALKHDALAATLAAAQERADGLEIQIDNLASWILTNVPGEPSQNQGACETAMRIMATLQVQLATVTEERNKAYDLLWGARCIYCGDVCGKDKQNQEIGDEVLKAHIEQCPKHPVTKLKAERDALVKHLEAAIKHMDKECVCYKQAGWGEACHWFDNATKYLRQHPEPAAQPGVEP